VELLALYSSFGTIGYLKYPVFSARHRKTQIRIDILVLGLFFWGEKMVNKQKREEALEPVKTNNLFKRDRKEDANGIGNHLRTEQLCPV